MKKKIKPIHKAKFKYNKSNYRPTSLISNLAKIFGKVISNKIYHFIKKHKILSKKQYGLLKNPSAMDPLSFLTNLIYEKLDKSTSVA